MKRYRVTIIVCGIAVVVGAAYVGLCAHFPPPPASWLTIRRGETQADLRQRQLVDSAAYIPIKLLDQNVAFSDSAVYGRTTHFLLVWYDDSGHVRDAQIDCETERFRLWRRRERWL